MFIQRYLKCDLPQGQSCFFWGARKSGKSTYLKQQFPESFYIDLLQADTYRKYSDAPQRLREEINSHNTYTTIIIDEVQKIPALLDEVHHMIETNKNLKFILCGSSARRLKFTGANLLGGRAWRYVFMPFCYAELKTLDWNRIFNHGLIPNHYLASSNIGKFLSSYLLDYILPEVQFEANLRKRDAFTRFLYVLGLSHGEMINCSNIARECGVDSKTVRTYFEILEDMYLGYHISPYKSRSKRQIITETPKFYLFDTGIANYLRQFEYKEMSGTLAGKAFEHYIILELIAYKNLNEKREQIFYWRTKSGYEVDAIIGNNAFEIKISSSIERSDLKGLIEFAKDNNEFKLHVISMEKTLRITNIENTQIIIWPVQMFLEALWKNEIW
ncbi:MAG: hypothetical protein RLZZ59_374 [Pseudomonadota bacterium]|jgi:predicted AAA+ superfamily ATPase